MAPEQFTAYFLAAFYTGVAAFYVVLARLRVRKDTSTQLIHMGRSFSLHWWNHLVFRVFRLLIWAVCVIRVFYPPLDQYLGVCPTYTPLLAMAGMLLLAGGFTLAIAGNMNLNSVWRSGVDEQGPQRLVTHRLYAFSRNPMYIGVKIAQIGFVLALPSVFSLICLVVGWLAVDVQVRLEEKHLSSRFSGEYDNYRRRVARWVSIAPTLRAV